MATAVVEEALLLSLNHLNSMMTIHRHQRNPLDHRQYIFFVSIVNRMRVLKVVKLSIVNLDPNVVWSFWQPPLPMVCKKRDHPKMWSNSVVVQIE